MNIREVIIKNFFKFFFRTYERNVGCDLSFSTNVVLVCFLWLVFCMDGLQQQHLTLIRNNLDG